MKASGTSEEPAPGSSPVFIRISYFVPGPSNDSIDLPEALDTVEIADFQGLSNQIYYKS